MMESIKPLCFLHALLFVYSFSNVFLKLASDYDLLSPGFILFYGLALSIMALYAIFWQQILKKLPLSTAFSNKAITIIWGMILGAIIFHESISFSMVIGSVVILVGIITIARSNE